MSSDRTWRSALSPKELINIEFKKLTYKVSTEEKLILDHISGRFGAGQLSAIIGQSGSGKTTLLNTLAGYKCKESSGAILVNGQPKNDANFTKISRYIMQVCVFTQGFSVLETMMFAARLKLGKASEESLMKIVNEILIILRLDNTRKTSTSDLSGGEKRRLSIALELINNPSVLFLDEPTTGLDYYSSTQCVHLLRDLANTGRTVVCSLHTPTSQTLSLCDNVFVVAYGQCAFQGNVDNIVPFLEKFNLICPTHYNPADYIIEVCSGEYGDYTKALVNSIENGKIIIKDVMMDNKFEINGDKPVNNYYETSWLDQFWILWKRMLMQVWRDKVVFTLKLAGVILAGLTFGLLHMNKGQDGAYTQFNMPFLVATVIFMVYFYALITIFIFSMEWTVFKREHFNRWYKLSAYYCASFASKLPFHVAFGTIFVSMFYLLIDYPLEIKRYSVVITMLVLTGLVSESIAEIGAILFQPIHALFTFLTISITFVAMILQEGNYLYETPFWLKFVGNFNFLLFAYKGLTSILFEDRERLRCSKFCYFPDLDKVLHNFGTGYVVWWMDMLALVIMLMVYKIVGYYAFKLRANRRINYKRFLNILELLPFNIVVRKY